VNVRLRDLAREDAAWLDTWLAECASSVAYDEIKRDEPSRSLFARVNDSVTRVRVIEAASEPVGVVVFSTSRPAMIEFVGVQPSSARRGYGQVGATLAEDDLHNASATSIYVPAPAVHGIAVYFWIRLGYHPLLKPEWPCERKGVAWMRRDLD
jgi:hypothetical protein